MRQIREEVTFTDGRVLGDFRETTVHSCSKTRPFEHTSTFARVIPEPAARLGRAGYRGTG